jgi:hypothetical protein
MKVQHTYRVITSWYKDDDLTKPNGMKLRVRASDEDRALLAARQHTQRKLYQLDQPTALDNITAKIV